MNSPLLRIRGLAKRAVNLGPDVTVPDSLPVLLEFSHEHGPVGTAALTCDGEGIHADATLNLTGFLGHVHERGGIGKHWPYFALAYRTPFVKGDAKDEITLIKEGEVVGLSLSRANRDPELPPWEVVSDG